MTLALKTLGSFDFSNRDLLSFVKECVLSYLDDDNQIIRKEAALTCSQLLLNPVKSQVNKPVPLAKKLDPSTGELIRINSLTTRHDSVFNVATSGLHSNVRDFQNVVGAVFMSPAQIVMVGDVLERLLTVGISDPDWQIRRTILSSLDTRCDFYLAQSENLHSLFIALNDEVYFILIYLINKIRFLRFEKFLFLLLVA